MPSKNIEDRREAYRKWAYKNKQKRADYQRILYIAKKANPLPQECIEKDCKEISERHHPDYSKPEEIVWVCKIHHRRIYHKGSCTICGDKVLARGFCNKHYKSERRKIDPIYNASLQKSHHKKL